MIRAYILVECEMGKTASAVKKLGELDGVAQIDAVLGLYDVVLFAEKPDIETMGNFVTDRVQAVPGVQKTTTCLSSRLDYSTK